MKKSLKEIELEIIELKKSHQNKVEDVKRKYNDLKEAFETLSKKYEKVKSNPAVKAVKMCNENDINGRDLKKHLRHSLLSFNCKKCDMIFNDE